MSKPTGALYVEAHEFARRAVHEDGSGNHEAARTFYVEAAEVSIPRGATWRRIFIHCMDSGAQIFLELLRRRNIPLMLSMKFDV
jgi:hypothetical protein